MLIDLSSLVLISLYGFLGWRKGIALAALSIIGLVAGYTAAYFFYEPVGQALGNLLGLQPLIALPLGGSAIFIAVLLLAGVGRFFIRGQRRGHQAAKGARYIDGLGGMVLGASHGAALVVLIVWALTLLELLAPMSFWGAKDSFVGRLVAPFSQKLTYWVAKETGGNETVATAVAQLAQEHPQKIQSVVQIVQDRRIKRLFADPTLVQALATNNIQNLRRSRSLRALFRDPEFLQQVKESGLLPEATPNMSPDELKIQVAKLMVPFARVVVGMARDPEFQRLLQDKELMRKLEQRDVLALLNDPLFNRLAIKTTALLKGAPLTVEDTSSGGSAEGRIRIKNPREPLPPDSMSGDTTTVKSPIYKWKDKQGVVHYADQRPPPGVNFELVNLERSK